MFSNEEEYTLRQIIVDRMVYLKLTENHMVAAYIKTAGRANTPEQRYKLRTGPLKIARGQTQDPHLNTLSNLVSALDGVIIIKWRNEGTKPGEAFNISTEKGVRKIVKRQSFKPIRQLPEKKS